MQVAFVRFQGAAPCWYKTMAHFLIAIVGCQLLHGPLNVHLQADDCFNAPLQAPLRAPLAGPRCRGGLMQGLELVAGL